MNSKSKSVNIPRELATGSMKFDETRRARLQQAADELLTYFQTNPGMQIWGKVQARLVKSGAQKKDVSDMKRFLRDFPVFQVTNGRGVLNPQAPPYYISIPQSQENVEGDADGIAVVQQEDARGRLRDRIWGRGRVRAREANSLHQK